jgi:hypothetical protein
MEITVKVTASELFDIYFWGMADGQLLMEEERESEELFDAAVCAYSGRKFGVPSAPARRRQVHSEKWFAAMRQGKQQFNAFIKKNWAVIVRRSGRDEAQNKLRIKNGFTG